MEVAEAHEFAREQGTSRPVVKTARGVAIPYMKLVYALTIDGAENIPAEGPVIVTPNHKSFWDAFFVAAATKRPIRFMGKSELFEGPAGKTLIRLGAFPVRRGTSDEEAIETAREILRGGGLLALFPEGTRVRDPATLGTPHKGAARLALETGATIVPAAITGTERLFAGPLPRPGRVRVSFGEPVDVAAAEPTPEAAEELLRGQVWPEVERERERLLTHPGVIAAGLTALGIGAGVAARRRRK
ncbi:MAG TPA: lysophospholipid acyltransferase family protein [Solirubrobacterales bacterium]|nr:lysophospholipid acyltransferase family protein [Solirubrobacterales bacterium]